MSIYQWFSGAFTRIALAHLLIVEIWMIPGGRKRIWWLTGLFFLSSTLSLLPLSAIQFYSLLAALRAARLALDGQACSPYAFGGKKDKQTLAMLVLEKPKAAIRPVLPGENVVFQVDVDISGFITQLFRQGPVREIEIETEAAKKIEEEIRGLFEKGLKLGADTLQLGHTLYRKHPHEWHRLQKNSALPLRPDMLESVNVQVHINDGGISKVKQKP